MTDLRIPQDQWQRHDLKKLWGLVLLLLAALVSWMSMGMGAPSGPDQALVVIKPAPWPKVLGPTGDFTIEGASRAKLVKLMIDGVEAAKSDVPAPSNNFSFTLPAMNVIGKSLEIVEVWDDTRSVAHPLDRIESEGEPIVSEEVPPPDKQTPFTLDTHKDGVKIKAGNNDFGGEAKPGSEVYLFMDNYTVGKATAGSDGRWKVTRFVHESRMARRVGATNQTTGEKSPAVSIDVNP